jgi:hypothetical protein
MGREEDYELTLNNGFKPHRFKSSPLEKRFAEQWKNKNLYTEEVLEHILSIYGRVYDAPTNEERRTANGVIQWLGSPVGLSFLRHVLNIPDPCRNCVVQACCSKRSTCDKYQSYIWAQSVKGKK